MSVFEYDKRVAAELELLESRSKLDGMYALTPCRGGWAVVFTDHGPVSELGWGSTMTEALTDALINEARDERCRTV